MKAVITGDVVNSRKAGRSDEWLIALKEELKRVGDRPTTWEVYRGDSFQLILEDPRQAFRQAMILKARLRQFNGLDLRMGIGIGKVSIRSERITESQGSAFSRSGDAFDLLEERKGRTLILTEEDELNRTLNLMLRWISITADHWSVVSAEMTWNVLLDPDRSQMEWAKELGIRQSSVSERFQRARIDEIMETDTYFRERINALILHS
ncbi:MAG: SatD family protein [Bacteroidota bacterium]|nr:SatD family protein [Bacteroidota bacterium]MDX5429073.1 SatD family protein [Bacteroidota bacterium]MDX5447975.1 SatD family protein [Bacteroidota bacterium]